MTLRAYKGASLFDGRTLVKGHAALVEQDRYVGAVAEDALPADVSIIPLAGGVLTPGFVDLQVNGGGGVMFNDETTVAGLATVAAAHRATGTRAILPTLITDTPERTRLAVDAVVSAIEQDVPGIIGLHLEGPHLDPRRKGAHDEALIRPMEDRDLEFLSEAAVRLPNLMVTIAPESVSVEQIRQLAAAGVILALGHSDCSAETAQEALCAGAVCVTHLFNAMSQMSSRAPGLVGATLATHVKAGLIADGIHVHPTAIRAAVAAKGAERVFLVTDAMATVGSDIGEFQLSGRRVLRHSGRLTLEDGTLAGADLTLTRALQVMTGEVGLPLEQALAMATGVPAGVLRLPRGVGVLEPGGPWTAIHLDEHLRYSELPD
ncbi:N-acetylglucosamine-6-phosphate deacetylase [Lutimaribacter marinistellae]|uniref:N-acetylglucosamine-6-phosphate deacetylase n=1 Tax=Lutimaribacter marinistellae TaxID=1820329 RepID=A0ABV7TQJ3_9RHOB